MALVWSPAQWFLNLVMFTLAMCRNAGHVVSYAMNLILVGFFFMISVICIPHALPYRKLSVLGLSGGFQSL